MLISIVGGLFLLWIACKPFRSAASSTEIRAIVSSSEHRPWRYLIRGLTVQISNVNAALTWIAIIMSLGVQEDAPTGSCSNRP